MTDKKTTQTPESLPWPFNYARLWDGVELYEKDLNYINNVITSDKMYRLIRQAHEINTNFIRTNKPDEYDDPRVISTQDGLWRDFVELRNAIHFFSKFLDDQNCPLRVKYFLWQWIGNYMGYMKFYGVYDNYVALSFLTERWMEKCH